MGIETTLAIDPPMWRPLRARGLEHVRSRGSGHLRPLAGDSHLVALICIDADRTSVAEIARDVILRMASALPPSRIGTARFPAGRGARVKTGRGAPKSMLSGKRFTSLVEAMASDMSVEVDAFSEHSDEMSFHPTWSIAVGLGLIPVGVEQRVPTLHVTANIADASDSQRADISAILEQALDRAIVMGALSGAIRRMGTPGGRGVDHSDYETACGIQGSFTTSRAWCSRWLRMPGELTWLGPSLVAHLDRDAGARAAAAGQGQPGRGDGHERPGPGAPSGPAHASLLRVMRWGSVRPTDRSRCRSRRAPIQAGRCRRAACRRPPRSAAGARGSY